MKLIELEIDLLLSPTAPPLATIVYSASILLFAFSTIRHLDLGVFREAVFFATRSLFTPFTLFLSFSLSGGIYIDPAPLILVLNLPLNLCNSSRMPRHGAPTPLPSPSHGRGGCIPATMSPERRACL